MHYAVVPDCWICLPLSHLQWLSLPIWGWIWSLCCLGQSGAVLGLSWLRPGICQNFRNTALQDTSLCCPLRNFHWWMEHAVRPIVCPQHTAKALVKLVCGVFFPSPWSRCHFNEVLTTVMFACTVPQLQHCFECTPAKGVLDMEGLQESAGVKYAVLAKYQLVGCGRGPTPLQKIPGAVDLQKGSGMEHTVRKLGEKCSGCPGSHKCPCI